MYNIDVIGSEKKDLFAWCCVFENDANNRLWKKKTKSTETGEENEMEGA